MTKRAVRKHVRSTRKDPWTAQKEATMHRVAWLKENAQNIAKTAGNVDWGKNTKNMVALAHDCGVNTLRGNGKSVGKEIQDSHHGIRKILDTNTNTPLLHATSRAQQHDPLINNYYKNSDTNRPAIRREQPKRPNLQHGPYTTHATSTIK